MTKEKLQDVHARIKPFIHRTPVLSSTQLNEIAGCELFFKCENFQKMGAFKMRGATNAILTLSKDQQRKGVVTHSSGNFAQALSLAAKAVGVKAYIVMPTSAPMVKREAVAGYGGEIVLCEPTLEARERTARQMEIKTGATFIHPSDDLDVIYGQGTSGIELLQDYPDLNIIVTPVGGGGLIAGNALAAKFFGKDCSVYGGEPMNADDAYRSLQSGKIETNVETNTVADGLRTNLGKYNFPIIKENVEAIIRVEEDMIIKALKLIWQRMKIVVEPSSAVALAAVLTEPEVFKGKQVGIIISGGNVDLDNLPF